jgi:hypothetical protein
VYIFFILQYPFFGVAMFATLLAFPIGGLIGQKFAIRALPALNATTAGQAAIATGLMSAIVRVNADAFTARLVQLFSIANIAAVTWLEIKILTTVVMTVMFDLDNVPFYALEFGIIAGFIAALLTQFVLRFGMQGVVATDAMYWPFIILSVVIVVFAAFGLSFELYPTFSELTDSISLQPLIDSLTLGFFLINIFLVNAIYHVGRDDLWLRLSAFGSKGGQGNLAASHLFRATLFAAPVWLVLILVGMLISVILGVRLIL